MNYQTTNNANSSGGEAIESDTTSSAIVPSNIPQQLTRNENGNNNNSSTGEFLQILKIFLKEKNIFERYIISLLCVHTFYIFDNIRTEDHVIYLFPNKNKTAYVLSLNFILSLRTRLCSY